jgi:hypothetical protein
MASLTLATACPARRIGSGDCGDPRYSSFIRHKFSLATAKLMRTCKAYSRGAGEK